MDTFCLIYTHWDAKEQKLREALCTLGNGYFATRGAVEETASNEFNYPGTYLAGGYNRAKTNISGKTIENEDLVNFPNWLCLSFRPKEGAWLDLEDVEILEYEQKLEMKRGVLSRKFKIKDSEGRITHIKSLRVVSMKDRHLAGIQWSFTPENWSGEVDFRTALDGGVVNDNVARYRDLESVHLKPLYSKLVEDNILLLLVQTNQSKITMAQAARTRIYSEKKVVKPTIQNHQTHNYIEQILTFPVKQGQEYQIEKLVAVYTNKDPAISEPSLEACKDMKRTRRFKELLLRQEHYYKFLWHRADIGIIGNKKVQQLTRLHIFHNLQTISPNTIPLDVGVPARGLHGEAYRGHIFWDELYIFPYFNYRFSDITRSLLMYRYYRLDEARFAAKEAGYKGAMFPWQSGSNGREETQTIHLNPQSGNWNPDNTHLQRHVNSAIAYNIWHYYIITDDKLFLSNYGAEIFLSIAQFWSSKAEFNKKNSRFEIHEIVGPDEYHTSYPNSKKHGLKNNAYTNLLAAWVLQKALEILELIEKSRRRELLKHLEISEKELLRWKSISTGMFIPFIEEGIIAQFEGYEKLKEFDWEKYRKKYDNIQRLDRILESENDSTNNYKVSKQADVLMLFYIFSRQELYAIFEKLGYEFTEEKVKLNIDYYKNRTSHGSTLSRLVFSWILSKYDNAQSWENFETVLISDFKDIQGGTTPEGIHLGAMAGSLDLVQRIFAGLSVGDDALWIKPRLPESIKMISMRINYRNHWIHFSVNHKKIKISFEEGWSNAVNIGIIDKVQSFNKGEAREFFL